jgi:hypothetical protein
MSAKKRDIEILGLEARKEDGKTDQRIPRHEYGLFEKLHIFQACLLEEKEYTKTDKSKNNAVHVTACDELFVSPPLSTVYRFFVRCPSGHRHYSFLLFPPGTTMRMGMEECTSTL